MVVFASAPPPSLLPELGRSERVPDGTLAGTPDSIPPPHDWSAKILLVKRIPSDQARCCDCWRPRFVSWIALFDERGFSPGPLCGPCMTDHLLGPFARLPLGSYGTLDDSVNSFGVVEVNGHRRCYWCWRWTRRPFLLIRPYLKEGELCRACMTSLVQGGEPPWKPNH